MLPLQAKMIKCSFLLLFLLASFLKPAAQSIFKSIMHFCFIPISLFSLSNSRLSISFIHSFIGVGAVWRHYSFTVLQTKYSSQKKILFRLLNWQGNVTFPMEQITKSCDLSRKYSVCFAYTHKKKVNPPLWVCVCVFAVGKSPTVRGPWPSLPFHPQTVRSLRLERSKPKPKPTVFSLYVAF